MRLIRTASVAMLTDDLSLEDDAGARVPVARPTAGVFSASMLTGGGDECYRWRAQLFVRGGDVAVALDAYTASAGAGETCARSWFVRGASGFAYGDAPDWAAGATPVDEASGS